ncbi:hypothetical protein BKA67DRAFT_580443 [Truncatella angustata]|uniref:BTB domain-containing protein n=1 Tax=Truncatella angustata TaxID=152316 RepID=A0A9P8RIN4_9PEZI|nr:uncharacterized protein BKA67DRAFT_580443 [Truncatella angustata]KAH6646748.1 hypothetical protein BKA67DRAFT_580443 [Truncatella angustata]
MRLPRRSPINLLSGKKRNDIFMHAGAITSLSRTLDVLIHGSCSGTEKLEEARTGIIPLPHVDQDTFVRFFEFAYAGDYFSAIPTVDSPVSDAQDLHEDPKSTAVTEPIPDVAEDVVGVHHEVPPQGDDIWAFSGRRSKKPKKNIRNKKKKELF